LSYSKKNKKWSISGDPTEASIMVLAQKIGFKKETLEKEMTKIDEVPFNYDLKYHTTLHSSEKKSFLSVVGSPEILTKLSQKIWEESGEKMLTKSKREQLNLIQNSFAKKGLRVVAFAYRKIDPSTKKIPAKIDSLVFGGFFAIMDGLRENVKLSVEKVNQAGIKLVMITGDYKLTAKTIGEEAGIFKEGDEILTGEEIEKCSQASLAEKIDNVTIFARVAPVHKLKIINAYKLRGDIVAMTGDGVNDALSLTSADVGVAMGKIGTEVAKEASDIILLDDNFASIVGGVTEGRNIFKSIKKVILYLFSTGAGELLTIVGALLFDFPLPILAAQILWLNLVTDGFLDISLSMEPPEEKKLKGKSQPNDGWLVDKMMGGRIILMAIPMAIGTLFLFSKFYEADLVKAWTISLTTLSVFQWFNAWNCRSQEKSIFQMNFFSNKFLIGATLLVFSLHLMALYTPFMQKILRTVPLNLSEWIVIIIVSSSVIFVEETRKIFVRNFSKK
jgi:Ca2+-transporting ATPase